MSATTKGSRDRSSKPSEMENSSVEFPAAQATALDRGPLSNRVNRDAKGKFISRGCKPSRGKGRGRSRASGAARPPPHLPPASEAATEAEQGASPGGRV